VEVIWKSDILAVGVVLFGLCVGSFLNVVIYRVPRGLSVNDPKRSFCPSCQATLPVWQNIPVLTWLLQRGRCRFCGAPIPVRYLIVEVLTGGLFFLAWWTLPTTSSLLAMVLFTILVTVTFIDAEHQLIPIWWTSVGSLVGLLGGMLFSPVLLDLSGETLSQSNAGSWAGLVASGMGWLVGFGGLALVVLLGKVAFGRFRLEFDKAEDWKLQEGVGDNQQLHAVIGKQSFSWDDLFYRESDCLRIEGHGFRIDGKKYGGKLIEIRREEVKIGEKRWGIADVKSVEGQVTKAVIPREAMGMGDPHLLGMIGAFLGWPAVIFVVLSSCFYAILAALVGRIGFGRPLPFGPFLAMGALSWIFGGWELWSWYYGVIQGAR
jgi:leader peptidase (prepilin peptidase)/N-methyltransferase